MLKGEQAMTVDWSLRKPELEALKAENKSVRQISEIMGTSMCAIQHAVTRFRLTG
jgi:transposase